MDWVAPHEKVGDPNPLDHAGRALPPCELDPLVFGPGEFGSFPNREYQVQQVLECLGEFDDEDADFKCIGLGQDRLAASYSEHDNALCRCGGLPLANSVCFLPASVQYQYSAKFSVESTTSKHCTAHTNWTAGRFVHGRYEHDSCKLLDINPKSLVRHFAGQFVFVDGDSHQQDLFWGLVAEIRNQRFFAVPSFPPDRRFSEDVRYEVSATFDHLELLAPGELNLANATWRTCYRTQQPDCVVFVFRFDRMRADYLKSLAELAQGGGAPDVLLGGFSSRTYTTPEDPQEEIKEGWEALLWALTRPMGLAWSSFPMNSVFIVRDMTEWAEALDYPKLYSHFALVEAPLWDALVKNSAPSEPGFLTLQLIWHADCRVGVDFVRASESCSSPIPRTLYPAALSVMATARAGAQ